MSGFAGAVVALVSGVSGAHPGPPRMLDILLPVGRPEIVIATNVGLVMTSDEGRSWAWMCEYGSSLFTSRYWAATARLYTLAGRTLAASDDWSCSWRQPMREGNWFDRDLAPHPTDPNKVWILSATQAADGGLDFFGVYSSVDGARTMGDLSYRVPPDADPANLAVAPGDPRILYLTMRGPNAPAIARSFDEGKTWELVTIGGIDPTLTVRRIFVDSDAPRKLFLEIDSIAGDQLAVSIDGGQNASVVVRVRGQIASLLRQQNGHIRVVAVDSAGSWIYLSTDGGSVFGEMPASSPVRAFAERDGRLFMLAEYDGRQPVLTLSNDQGVSFNSYFRLQDTPAVMTCPDALNICRSECLELVSKNVFQANVCEMVPTNDADVPDAGGSLDGNDADASPPTDVQDAPEVPKVDSAPAESARSAGGCSCLVSSGMNTTTRCPSIALLAGLLYILGRRRRRAPLAAARFCQGSRGHDRKRTKFMNL